MFSETITATTEGNLKYILILILKNFIMKELLSQELVCNIIFFGLFKVLLFICRSNFLKLTFLNVYVYTIFLQLIAKMLILMQKIYENFK